MSDLRFMPPRHPDLSDEEYQEVCNHAAERAAERAENTEDQPQQYAVPTDPYAEDEAKSAENRRRAFVTCRSDGTSTGNYTD